MILKTVRIYFEIETLDTCGYEKKIGYDLQLGSERGKFIKVAPRRVGVRRDNMKY